MDAPPISKFTLGFFRRIARRYFRRHFTAVRVANAQLVRALGPGPLIVYANHSSWWDPMVCVVLAERFFPGRAHYAPMDADALKRYGILRHIGIFGVEMNSARGAARFLRTGLAILEHGGVLWVTPQGRFADAREPLRFKPGLAALAARVPGGCTLLPLAIEYPFWDERLPETLLHFGDPIRVQGGAAPEVEAALRSALEEAMTALRTKSMAREPAGFELLARGRVGTGGFYALGQRVRARLLGRPYQAEHTLQPPLPLKERG